MRCPVCGSEFEGSPRKIYCSRACREKCYRRRASERFVRPASAISAVDVTDETMAMMVVELSTLADEIGVCANRCNADLRPMMRRLSEKVTDALRSEGLR